MTEALKLFSLDFEFCRWIARSRAISKVHGRNRRAFGLIVFIVLLREIRFGKDVETRYRIERSRKSRSKIRRLRHQVFVLIVVFDISIPFGHGSSIFQLQSETTISLFDTRSKRLAKTTNIKILKAGQFSLSSCFLLAFRYCF